MAEARDCHCYSHVFENLGERSVPSDHAAVRVVMKKPTIRGSLGKRMPSPLWKISVILEKAGKRTVHELLRKTPVSLGAQLLNASTH